jgi:hypothetical protein
MEKELARAVENVEAVKRELKTSKSRQEASKLRKAETEKELVRGMENIEALKRELETS